MREQRSNPVLAAQRPGRQQMTPGERVLRARAAAYAMHAKHGSRKAALKDRLRSWPNSSATSIPTVC
jgi:hypothetical protein